MSGIDVAIWCVIVGWVAFHAGLIIGALIVGRNENEQRKIR